MAVDTSRDAVDDGGPAFPADAHAAHNDPAAGLLRPASQGMTLRDWFAGQALAGLLGGNATYRGETTNRGLLAADAYAHADAMLAARKGGSDER